MDTFSPLILAVIVIAFGAMVYVASETKKIFPAALLFAAACLVFSTVGNLNPVGPNLPTGPEFYPSRIYLAPARITGPVQISILAANPWRADKVLRVDVNRHDWNPRVGLAVWIVDGETDTVSKR